MKKLQGSVLSLFAIINIGCGGGSSDVSATHTPQTGYWEIQNPTTGSTLYKGFSNPAVLMLDQNNLSWNATFGSTFESTGSTATNIKYTFIGFSPIDSSQTSSNPEFSMNDAGTESSAITLYGNNAKLIFDPTGIHNSATIIPSKFANLTWTDQRDSHNTFVTTDTTFTIVSNLTALAGGDCSFNGTLPTTTVNYASVQVNYSCVIGATGTTYVQMASNANSTQMIIGINGDSNLQSHTMLFK